MKNYNKDEIPSWLGLIFTILFAVALLAGFIVILSHDSKPYEWFRRSPQGSVTIIEEPSFGSNRFYETEHFFIDDTIFYPMQDGSLVYRIVEQK